jgi:hypothetical protein
LTPPKPAKQVEKDVVQACLDYLKLRGYYPIRQHCGKFWTWDKTRILTGAAKGTPDWAFMHAVYPGFLLEAKRPGEEPSAQQALCIRDIYIGYRLDIVVIDSIDTLRAFVDRREKRLRDQWSAS